MKIREWARHYAGCEDCGKVTSSTVSSTDALALLEEMHLERGCKAAKNPPIKRPLGAGGGHQTGAFADG